MGKRLIALCLVVLTSGCAEAQATTSIEGEWRLFEPDINTPSLGEIGFFYGEEVHAEPYMTCTEGSGWVSISQGMPNDYDGLMRLRSGEHSLDLPTVATEGLGVSVQAMIPADQIILKEAALGRSLQIDTYRYVAKSGEERSAIRQFIARCRAD